MKVRKEDEFMKKKVLGILMVIVTVFTFGMPQVFAAASDWQGYEGAGVTVEGDKITVDTSGSGTINTSYSKTPITSEGVSMSINVMIDLSVNDTFTITSNVGNMDGNPEKPNYVGDFVIITEIKDGKAVISSPWAAYLDTPASFEIDRSGVYTYTWTFKKATDGKVTAQFDLSYYGTTVETLVYNNEKWPIDDATVLRTMWAYGGNNNNASRPFEKPFTIWNELPYVTLTLSAEGVEEKVPVPYAAVLNEDEVQTIIDEVNAELKDTGYVFKGFYSDAELKVEYDFTKPFVQDATLYMKLEKEISNKEEEKIDNPNTSDIGLVGIVTTIVLAGAGLGYTIKKRKFN